MTERPIIFSAPMVRAILAGRKTQTRRIIKPRSKTRPGLFAGTWSDDYVLDPGNASWRADDVRYAIDDMLWVRETCSAIRSHDDLNCVRYEADQVWLPVADDRWLALHRYGKRHGANVPSIHMPRWASRITLKVTGVKVERLQDISEDDAAAEGVTGNASGARGREGLIEDFTDLWESINGPGSWEANPWVVAISFERAPASGGGG